MEYGPRHSAARDCGALRGGHDDGGFIRGALAATGGDDKISHIWSIETGALIHEEQFDARVSQVSWAPHDRQLAVAAGMAIRVLRENDRKWIGVAVELKRSVDAVTFLRSRLVAAAGQELVIFEGADLREVQRISLPAACKRLVSNGSLVGAVLQTGAKLFDGGEKPS